MEMTGIKLKPVGKIYYLAYSTEFEEGSKIVVETSRGLELATVVIPRKEISLPQDDFVKQFVRFATPKDLTKANQLANRAKKEISTVNEIIASLKMDIKASEIEYTIDGKKMIISFASDDRIDFRDLVKKLVSKYHCKIELHQIGIRDEVKNKGGLGLCGRECCCSSFLQNFDKVSIKMAKNQNLALNPNKISGLCGKLLCCLSYENDFYTEQNQKFPKVNSLVKTPEGEGIVMYNNLLKEIVSIKFVKDENNFEIKDIPLNEVQFVEK